MSVTVPQTGYPNMVNTSQYNPPNSGPSFIAPGSLNNMGTIGVSNPSMEGAYTQTLQPDYQARGTYIDSSQMSSVFAATQIAEHAYTSARQQGFKDTGRATTIDPSQVPFGGISLS